MVASIAVVPAIVATLAPVLLATLQRSNDHTPPLNSTLLLLTSLGNIQRPLVARRRPDGQNWSQELGNLAWEIEVRVGISVFARFGPNPLEIQSKANGF